MLHLLACGNVSNQIFTSDAEFLAALPSEDTQTLEFEDGLAGGGPALLTATDEVVTAANGFVAYVLGIVDDVRTLPPSARTEDSRTWGPYPIENDSDADGEIVRVSDGRFDWTFHCTHDGDTETIVSGVHYAGDTVSQGDGAFTWDATAAGWCQGTDTAGTLDVDYDNRAGIDIVGVVDDWSDGTIAPLDYDYAFALDDLAGDFQYAVDWDVDDAGADEHVEVRTRWISGQGGRADAVVSEGDLGEVVERWTQCWDATGQLLYEVDSEGWFQETGDADACAWDDFAELDRI